MHQDGPRQDGIPMALADDVVRGIHWLIDIEVDRCQKVLGAASEIEGEEADRAVTVGFVTQRLHDCDQLLAATTSPLACSPGVTELAPRTAAFLRELALEVRLSALEELEEWTASALGGMAWGDGLADAEIASLRCRRVLEALEQATVDRLETMVQTA